MNNNIFQTLLDIIRFKGKPSTIPYSVYMLVATFVLATLTAAALLRGSSIIQNPIAYSAIPLFVQAVMFFMILGAHNISNRFVQSATAIFAVTTAFQVLIYLVVAVAGLMGLSVIFTVWSFAVQVYITRESLESTTGKAFLICFAIQIVAGMALFFAFPDTFNELRDQLLQQQTPTANSSAPTAPSVNTQ